MSSQFYTVSLFDYKTRKHSLSKKFADDNFDGARKYAEKLAKNMKGSAPYYQSVSILHYMKSGAIPRLVKAYYNNDAGEKVINYE